MIKFGARAMDEKMEVSGDEMLNLETLDNAQPLTPYTKKLRSGALRIHSSRSIYALGNRVTHLTVRRYVGVVVGLLEMSFLVGIHFGWPNMVELLKYEMTLTSQISPSDNITWLPNSNTSNDTVVNSRSHPNELDSVFIMVFEIAGSMSTLAALIVGVLYDTCGTRAIKLFGSVFSLFGMLMFAFFDARRPEFWYLALIPIAIGSSAHVFSNFETANLFRTRRFFVVTLFAAGYAASSMVFYIVRMLTERYGISRCSCFLFLAAFALVCFVVNTFVCLPVFKFDPAHIGYELRRPNSGAPALGERRNQER